MTSLKLLACDQCAPGRKIRRGSQSIDAHSDLIALKLPNFPNIHPFQYSDFNSLTVTDIENRPKSELRKQQIDLFKQVTGVDPELQKVIAVMVLNVRELMHIFRRIWQDFGPFPLIGCDSEGLVWHLSDDKIPHYGDHEV